VVLERDSNIPRLSALLDEVAALDRVYCDALARWDSRRAMPEGAASHG
jgi:hypothetical protein